MSVGNYAETVELDGLTYRVRPFETGDRAGVERAYATVVGRDPGPEWFEATLGGGVLAEPTVVVVECEGLIVGVLPAVPYRIAVGDATTVGLLARDVMVLPEHRRRGVFSAAANVALSQCLRHEGVSFVFGHSNAASRRACEKMGWTYPSMQPQFVRPRDVRAFVGERTRGGGRAAAATAALAVHARYRDARRRARRRLRPAGDAFDVSRVAGVPAERLAALHERVASDAPGLAPVFDAPTLRAHFSDPEFARSRTYVAARDGVDAAAVVVADRRWHRTRWRSVVHVAPLSDGGEREAALAAILDRLLAEGDAPDAHRVAVPFPTGLLRSFGFLPDRAFPMSRLEPPRLALGYAVVRDDAGIREALAADSGPLWHLAA